MPSPLRCDCEPHIWEDGSATHDDTCPIRGWCPHELGAYLCGIPCGCPCPRCGALADGVAAFEAVGGDHA